jgi:hypothetical protein
MACPTGLAAPSPYFSRKKLPAKRASMPLE